MKFILVQNPKLEFTISEIEKNSETGIQFEKYEDVISYIFKHNLNPITCHIITKE